MEDAQGQGEVEGVEKDEAHRQNPSIHAQCTAVQHLSSLIDACRIHLPSIQLLGYPRRVKEKIDSCKGLGKIRDTGAKAAMGWLIKTGLERRSW